MKELPYYRVVLMPGRRWAVVHRVPGTGVDAVDLEFATLRAAQATCVSMNQQRDCGWQLATIYQEKAA